MSFPEDVPTESVVVKICKVSNKACRVTLKNDDVKEKTRTGFMVSYFADTHAVHALEPTGVPLELVAKKYAEAWKVLGGEASVIEAAKEWAQRHQHGQR